MKKDILGELLDARKDKAIEIVIKLDPMGEEESEEQQLEASGLAPVGKDESADMLMDEDEQRVMKKKKKLGQEPKNLSERAKMYSMEE